MRIVRGVQIDLNDLYLYVDLTLVVNLALVIYHALDYTHSEDEERLISPDLEGLITEMTACDTTDDDEECGALSEGSETSECGRADTDDEGIERDSEPAPRRRRRRRRFMLKDVVEVRGSKEGPHSIGTSISSFEDFLGEKRV
ncbi:hypothetical protein B5X24_HaOG214374 [Helicoverpa armigera]|nr:hypothetical protein B5X24_HaOG214374 [Helicoverpa armigera]